ncbi:MAG: 3-isopropylmalate dehydratase large subunit [Chloroflexi bacterium]|nr:3-isopropylmalate dehydratase large subunit [Ardenticatenaceae bacterium]MBL1128183.1 3-isopropylmalate dehydratase large subunit [Chloroflexota bacterium]NOG34256.1 3-isopropylmalate dehydratase large subunit [Chloroflexota bacterium]GIK56370.1 MAG: 3-isopropylmalate dehydratase large subunit [Chloroflexota bacterium]
MGQTLTEQILSHKAGRRVQPGDLVVVEPDVAMGHDSLSPGIIKVMQERLGVSRVHNPEQVVLVLDHVAPASTVGVADNQNLVRRFAGEQGIRLFEVGRGICHQVLVEEGIARPGMIVVGSDSHSTSYGAVGAFGTGMGSTDVALVWATGKTWLRAPETLRVVAHGRFRPGVDAKDFALKLGRELTIAGATYRAIEYHGLEWLSLPGRQTISSMAIELGAKAGIFPPTGVAAVDWDVPDWLFVDPDATYTQTVTINLDELEPQVAIPHAVDDVVDVGAVAGTKVDVVFLGTCTNGRYEDMRDAADILKGRQLAPGTRLILSPASRVELQRAIADDTLNVLLEAGAILTTPGCGPCMGRHQGVLGEGDVCLSTGNRNFKGRMGHPSSQIYLASASVAAATAVTGVITDPRELGIRN